MARAIVAAVLLVGLVTGISIAANRAWLKKNRLHDVSTGTASGRPTRPMLRTAWMVRRFGNNAPRPA